MWLDRRGRKYEQVWASYLYACDINTIREDLNSLSMGSESMVDYAGGSNFKGRIYTFPRISIVEYQKKRIAFLIQLELQNSDQLKWFLVFDNSSGQM